MIKEKEILIKINLRNRSHFEKLGYLVDDEIYVSVFDLLPGSKFKVTAICEVCSSEKIIQYNKYLINKNRNDKGYYSCFKCKTHVKENTCMKRYGVKSYSMTNEFRENESLKWKGIKKGGDKGEKTMLERYGFTSYFKTDESKEYNRKWMSSDEFKHKSRKIMLERYGVDHYSKSNNFKEDMLSKKDLIVEKIKQTFLEKHGVDNPFKLDSVKLKIKMNRLNIEELRKNTCMFKYGVDNVIKVDEIKLKRKNTMISNGNIIPDNQLNSWDLYKKKVRNITKQNKKRLYEEWDGYDYYDDELIKGYLSYSHTHRFYPTMDHKISVFYGFINSIDPNFIGSIENLCITKRFINSTKSKMTEEDFLKS
jgi:hypothetical protein